MHPPRALVRLLLPLLALLAMAPARGAPLCSSDGQPMPRRLVERFLSADCATCWTTRPAPLPAGAVPIDWIVPSAQGDDAPLAAAAYRDGAERLAALQRPPPARSTEVRHALARRAPVRLRVAHGVPLGGYVGASIHVQPQAPLAAGPWTLWLLLAEAVPAGTAGTPVARTLARNLLVTRWDQPAAGQGFAESRPLGIPEGSDPQRLQVIGWVQDGQGRVLAAARSRCPPERAGKQAP